MTGWLPGDLIAEETTIASQHAGPCDVCQRAMLRGDRIARVVASGNWAHVGCLRKIKPT